MRSTQRMLLVLCAASVVLGSGACSNNGVETLDGAGGDREDRRLDYTEVREPCSAYDPMRRVFFGDLHVHTALSMDAWAPDFHDGPVEAYRFARGEAVRLSPLADAGQGPRTSQLDRPPLDFAAVTDHGEFLGETEACTTPDSGAYDAFPCVLYRGSENTMRTITLANQLVIENPRRSPEICGPGRADCPALAARVWGRIRQAAEGAYDRTSACTFTSFVGYEYTGMPGLSNIHRNVIFRNAEVPDLPVTYIEQPTPHGLRTELKRLCLDRDGACDVLAVPHNSNESNGNAFFPAYPGAATLDQQRAMAVLRRDMEPLVEIFQIKGDSECMSGLSGVLGETDELCAFEKTRKPDSPDCGDGTGLLGFLQLGCVSRLDYVRNVLLEGLLEEKRLGVNPYKLGVIADTDTHSATPGAVSEPVNAENDPGVQTRKSLVHNPGGLTAVWAEENSRDAIFEAFRRRETYGTSGPRIAVRFFGAWSYPESLCSDPDFARIGYADGVPMGADLPPRSSDAAAPIFAVSAVRESAFGTSGGTPLQRIQIVKGWIDEERRRHARVYDVAGDPDNGAGVDPETCEPFGEGFDTLCAVWSDPQFDPEESAYYYARVVQNPTCRWTTIVCNRFPPEERPEGCNDPDVAKVVQERAWTSPIWYGGMQ